MKVLVFGFPSSSYRDDVIDVVFGKMSAAVDALPVLLSQQKPDVSIADGALCVTALGPVLRSVFANLVWVALLPSQDFRDGFFWVLATPLLVLGVQLGLLRLIASAVIQRDAFLVALVVRRDRGFPPIRVPREIVEFRASDGLYRARHLRPKLCENARGLGCGVVRGRGPDMSENTRHSHAAADEPVLVVAVIAVVPQYLRQHRVVRT